MDQLHVRKHYIAYIIYKQLMAYGKSHIMLFREQRDQVCKIDLVTGDGLKHKVVSNFQYEAIRSMATVV